MAPMGYIETLSLGYEVDRISDKRAPTAFLPDLSPVETPKKCYSGV